MDIRHAEFQAMADVFLGAGFDPVKLKQVEDLQIEAHRNQAALARRHELHQIGDEEYVTAANALIGETLRRCEGVLGAKAFGELFGTSPDEDNGLIDRVAFLDKSTSAASSAHSPMGPR